MFSSLLLCQLHCPSPNDLLSGCLCVSISISFLPVIGIGASNLASLIQHGETIGQQNIDVGACESSWGGCGSEVVVYGVISLQYQFLGCYEFTFSSAVPMTDNGVLSIG
ncbi:unnamed protein product [Linum trigynum]|uniref:Uncharacterized protein n=1 Tax=Linum trigynum TaxID=586398 RepID=A0AAV2E411_9ROSI